MRTSDRPATVRRGDDVSNSDVPRRKRLDRPAAKGFYVGLRHDERTYAAVARRFGVSDVTVRKWAHRDGWPAAAAEADRKATERAVAVGERSRVQLAEQNARIRAEAGDRLESQLNGDKIDDALVVRIYEVSDKMVRLDRGESTENVEIRRVQPVIVAMLTRIDGALRLPVLGQRLEAFSVVLDEFEGELAALEAGGLDAA